MSYRVNRTEFLQLLSLVEPGLSGRGFIEQSQCFVFMGGWIIAYNDEVSVRTRSGLDAGFTMAVRGKELKTALENMTDDEVDLEPRPAELRVKARGGKKVGIRAEADILLPVEVVAPPAAWNPLPEDFRPALETVLPCAGTNQEEYVAACVHVTPHYLEASDRMQAARYNTATGAEENFLVRAASLAPAARMGLVKMGVTPEWLHLRNKTLIYSLRRHVTPYPDEQLNVGFAQAGDLCRLPQGAGEAAKLGAAFADGEKVRVRMQPRRMTVRGEGAFAWVEVPLECGYDGPEMSFRIDPKVLMRIVADHTDCEMSPNLLRVVGDRWTFFTILSKDGPVLPEADAPAVVEAA